MTNDLVKQFDRKGAFATYNLIDALSRNPTTIYAGADICAEAKSTILVQADRIEELEAKLAKLTKAADRVHDSYWNSTDGIIVGMYDLGEALRDACTTLTELTGEKA